MLGFPFAFKQSGVLVRSFPLVVTLTTSTFLHMLSELQLGLCLLLLVGAVSIFCMLLVVECKYQLEGRGIRVATYGDIGRAALGRPGQAFVNVALVISQMGFGVACTLGRDLGE